MKREKITYNAHEQQIRKFLTVLPTLINLLLDTSLAKYLTLGFEDLSVVPILWVMLPRQSIIITPKSFSNFYLGW